MAIKKDELSLKGWLIGITRALIIAIICFSFNETYVVLKSLSRNVYELNINVKNLINSTDKITTRVDDNSNDIHNLQTRVSVIEVRVK